MSRKQTKDQIKIEPFSHKQQTPEVLTKILDQADLDDEGEYFNTDA